MLGKDAYKEILQSFRDNGYLFGDFLSESGKKTIHLRHDIDFSVQEAHQAALIEQELGVTSTFFFMLTSNTYNLLSEVNQQCVRDIQAMGHQVSLHFDPIAHQDIDKGFQAERQLFEEMFDTRVRIVSIHRPGAFLENNNRQLSDCRQDGQPDRYPDWLAERASGIPGQRNAPELQNLQGLKMKVILFGCKDTTLHVARALKAAGHQTALVTISPEKGQDQEVAGYLDLTQHAHLFDSIYVCQRYDLKSQEDADHFKSISCELGIAIGWQRLVPENILTQFSVGVFGMHGSAQDLPYGRGRSPMNWSILEGRQWFYTNLFKYQAGVDDGPILDTECFSINESDTAETLHYKNTLSLVSLVRKNWDTFVSGSLTLKHQKSGDGTYYPKRNPADGLIDWSDSIFNIARLLRAVTQPFYGAFSFLDGEQLRMYRGAVFYTDIESHQFKEREYGEICDVFPNGKFLVRCNGGVLIVHEFDAGKATPAVGDRLESPAEQLKVFPRNRHGFFDCP
jgi:methionyl-tRNA formyltransferase